MRKWWYWIIDLAILGSIVFLLSLIPAARGTSQPVLPPGFFITHADGITYVCSTHPVYCTGNNYGQVK